MGAEGERLEADFDVSRTDHKALYQPNGKLLAWKCDVRAGALPPAVSKAIRTQYKGYKIDDAEKVTRDKTELYQIELDGTLTTSGSSSTKKAKSSTTPIGGNAVLP